MESPPSGRFNYDDSNRKSPKEGLDILNGLLMRQDFLLVPNGKLLVLMDLKNPIQYDRVQQVPAEELDPKNPKYSEHGQYDLAQSTFSINKLSMTDAEALHQETTYLSGRFSGEHSVDTAVSASDGNRHHRALAQSKRSSRPL